MDDWDFLTRIDDRGRMGALRLASPGTHSFLAGDAEPIPPVTRLRALEHLAQQAEQGATISRDEEDRELAMLIDPGSSLGGARPKASVIGTDGSLWMAKFPSHNDRWDVGAWEALLNDLAVRAGIDVPGHEVVRLGAPHGTFMARRFDRVHGARRLYASAMTLASKRDHDDASYLEIAEAISKYGVHQRISADLEQLFRRVIFNVLAGHRDDHLRNHGFLGLPGGWRLAPAFDLNPIPNRRAHAIAVDADSRDPDVGAVINSAALYRVARSRAREIEWEVREAIAGWPAVAEERRIGRDEIDLMRRAFTG